MKQTKRILSMLLCFVLLGTMLPLAAFAADAPQIYVGGVGMYDGDYLVAGATETTTEKPADNYAYYMDAVLTLHN